MKLISKRLNGYNQSTHHHNPGSGVTRRQGNNNTPCETVLCLSRLLVIPFRKYSTTNQESANEHWAHLDYKHYLFHHHFPNDSGNFYLCAEKCSTSVCTLHPDSSPSVKAGHAAAQIQQRFDSGSTRLSREPQCSVKHKFRAETSYSAQEMPTSSGQGV